MTRRQLTTLAAGLAMAVLIMAVASATPAHAALGLRDTPDRTWMTNGIVYAHALSEDGKTLYIGGRFNSVREKPPGTAGKTLAVNNVAAIDVATGAPVSTFKPAVTSNDGTAPVVRALAAENGRVYVGGNFTTVGGQAQLNLAAVDAASGAVAPFTANVGDNTSYVYALVADASRLYVGGVFRSVNGTSRGNLAAVNATTGAVDDGWRARANKVVRALDFGPANDGTIFAVGGFNSVSSGTSGPVARQSVARFDVATSNVHPWAIPEGQVQTDSSRNDNMTCWDATVTQSRIFVGCGLRPNFAAAYRLDNADSGDRVWQTSFGGNPQALAMSPDGSRLIVGGHFGINPIKQQVCGKPLGGLVALNPENGQIDCASNWVPHLDQNRDPSYDGTWELTTVGDQLWVGGGFVGVSGVPQSNLARFTYNPDLDAAEPTITRPRPAPGAEILDRTPTLRATVRDGESELAASNIKLRVDGAPASFAYDPDTDRLSRTTGRLSYGWHSVRVVAKDAAGNVASRSWSFKVVRGRGAPYSPECVEGTFSEVRTAEVRHL